VRRGKGNDKKMEKKKLENRLGQVSEKGRGKKKKVRYVAGRTPSDARRQQREAMKRRPVSDFGGGNLKGMKSLIGRG